MRVVKLVAILIKTLFVLGALNVVNAQDSIPTQIADKNINEQIEFLHLQIISTWLNQPKKALKYADLAIKMADSIGDQALISKSLRLKGGGLYYQGNYDSSLIYSRKSLKIATAIRDTILINNALNNIGLVYYNLGSYQSSLENLLRSLYLKRRFNVIYGRAHTLNNIGLVYNKLKHFEKARNYFSEALDFAQNHEDKNLQLYSLNNLAGTYLEEHDLDESKNYLLRAIALDVQNNNWNSVSLSGLGRIEQLRGNYKKSAEYFDKALILRTAIDDKNGISEIYYYQAITEVKKGEYNNALLYLDESHKLALDIGSKEREFENLGLYVKINELLDNTQLAFEYQKDLLKLRDTLFNENLAHNLADIQNKLKEDEANDLLRSKDKQIRQGKKFNNFLLVIVVLGVILLIFIFLMLNRNRKINQLLASRNQEIIEQKEEIVIQKETLINKNIALENAQNLIKEQNKKLANLNSQLQKMVDDATSELDESTKELKMANLELDNFIYKSSHDIKGPLATLLGVCNVALIDIKDEESRKYFVMLAETAKGLNEILARLKTVSDITNLNLRHERISFSKIIDACIGQIKNVVGVDNLRIEYSIDDKINFYSDPVIIDLIVFNMLQNAVKMQHKNIIDLIKIEVIDTKEAVILNFLDNGTGILTEDVDAIFLMFSKATINQQSLGLVLYLVKQCVLKLGGDIMLINDENYQNRFRITLPKY